jgi:hypothetical protein
VPDRADAFAEGGVGVLGGGQAAADDEDVGVPTGGDSRSDDLVGKLSDIAWQGRLAEEVFDIRLVGVQWIHCWAR